MGYCDRRISVDAAFETIESTVLPGVAAMLEDLCAAASAARRGGTPEANELQAIAAALDALAREVESIEPPHAPGVHSRRMSA